MKKLFKIFLSLSLITLTFLAGSAKAQNTINGAGATFPYPVYSAWAYHYEQIKGIKINYQSVGSGAGISQAKAGTVDFGATDAPLKTEDLKTSDLIQFPTLIGGVVPVVNLPQVTSDQIRLDSATLAQIFLGQIKKWNDPALQKLNPQLALPALPITVVHRSDGSGTSWLFTKYLSEVSAEWQSKVGFATSVAWPTGLGGKGNEGVASFVTRVKGSIGYVEYAYAVQNKLVTLQLQNRAGNFISATAESFMASAQNAPWQNHEALDVSLINTQGAQAWPITGATYILVPRKLEKAKHKLIFDFFDWAYLNGKDEANRLHYIPLPDNVIQQAKSKWGSVTQ